MHKYLGDTGIKMYDIFNFLSIIALLVMNMSQLKYKTEFLSKTSVDFIKNKSKKNKNSILTNKFFIAFVEIFFISLVQYGPVSLLTVKFGEVVNTGNNYFGVLFFIPFLLMLFFYKIKISPLKQLDIITPAYPLALIFAKIACFCSGCCNGVEYTAGLYNVKTELFEFPVQLMEAFLALIIFIFLMIYRKKAKEGTMYPVFLIAYSATRFFTEFLRHEEEIFLIFKTYHLLCLAGIIIGIAELTVVLKHGEKIKQFYKKYAERRKSII